MAHDDLGFVNPLQFTGKIDQHNVGHQLWVLLGLPKLANNKTKGAQQPLVPRPWADKLGPCLCTDATTIPYPGLTVGRHMEEPSLPSGLGSLLTLPMSPWLRDARKGS